GDARRGGGKRRPVGDVRMAALRLGCPMSQSSPTTGWIKLVALCVAIAVPAAVAISYGLAWFEPPVKAEGVSAESTDPKMMNTPFIWPGMRLPPATKSYEADLPDTEAVIGVSARVRHRAYRVGAMRRMDAHVINDLIGEVPVTVTYDDRIDTAQVFTSDSMAVPLDVWMGGYFNGMILRLNGRFFRQDSGRYMAPGEENEVALPTMPHTRTDWKTWRTTYPETDIHVGERRAGDMAPCAGRTPKS